MASRGVTAQRYQMYVADFETCDAWEQVGDEIPNQRVWLAGVKNLQTMQTTTFNNLDDFMKDILSRKMNVNREYAFHNLKFDGSFIVPWLLRNGYEVNQAWPLAKEFSVLIDDRNNWYSIRIQVTSKRRITLWDSLKLFPTALEYLHNTYGTPTHKIHEDDGFYNRLRGEDHVATDEELVYLESDLSVLAETLNAHIDFYGLRFKKTQASQSFYNFEQHFPAWKLRFPPLDEKVDKHIRSSYWGGISHVNKIHQGNDMYGVDVYDINSSYPYQLAYEKLPYGHMLCEYEGQAPDMSKFWVAECLVTFKVKEDKLPCIPTRAIIEGRPMTQAKWLEDSLGIVRMKFCCIDYLTMFDCYDIKIIKWVWVKHWAWKVQPEIQTYILKNNEDKIKYGNKAKVEHDLELKRNYLSKSQTAKINNNTFYGKFGEDIIKEGKTPYLEDDDIIYKVDRYELLKEGKRKFLPIAIAVTAWGRRQLVTLANHLGKDFIYCDTDSVHLRSEGLYKVHDLAEQGTIKLDSAELGAWDYEGHYNRARFLRSKCYYEQIDGEPADVTLAGLPADKHSGARSKRRSCITWDNFHIGLIIPPDKSNKLGSKRTPTGTKLIPVPFRITQNVFQLYF